VCVCVCVCVCLCVCVFVFVCVCVCLCAHAVFLCTLDSLLRRNADRCVYHRSMSFLWMTFHASRVGCRSPTPGMKSSTNVMLQLLQEVRIVCFPFRELVCVLVGSGGSSSKCLFIAYQKHRRALPKQRQTLSGRVRFRYATVMTVT
jgi:hypothetical protein